jgi:hypothetical protein
VLVDDRGCLVAGAGAWSACEELAAYAPLLANRAVVVSSSVSARLSRLADEVFVWKLSIDGAEALLCSRGSATSGDAKLARAAEGCRRILGALPSARAA